MCQMLQGLDRSRTFTTMCEDNEIFWMNEADKSLLVFTVCGGEGEMTIKIQYGYMEEDVESTFVVISYPYIMAKNVSQLMELLKNDSVYNFFHAANTV